MILNKIIITLLSLVVFVPTCFASRIHPHMIPVGCHSGSDMIPTLTHIQVDDLQPKTV